MNEAVIMISEPLLTEKVLLLSYKAPDLETMQGGGLMLVEDEVMLILQKTKTVIFETKRHPGKLLDFYTMICEIEK